ncbi:hypothetical protein E2542_SST17547 [Spatholobus suberectus]|nr:hypothetical protein E2542_SST17547 [Spatholobus suberectus]
MVCGGGGNVDNDGGDVGSCVGGNNNNSGDDGDNDDNNNGSISGSGNNSDDSGGSSSMVVVMLPIFDHYFYTQMPVSDPSSGRTFIWIISGLLFISIVAGGACLVAYLLLPESETSSSWIPQIGVALICLPWLFWLLTFLYRILSRIFGCRVRIGGDGSGGNLAATNADVEVASHAKDGELNRASSVASHESEMALAKSMAS